MKNSIPTSDQALERQAVNRHHQILTCCVCSNTEAEAFCQKEGFEYVQCTRCSHVFLGDCANLGRGAESRRKGKSHHTSPKKLHWDFSDFKRKHVYLPRLKTIARLTGSPGRLLDIGCSNGSFLQAAQSLGWNGEGIELRAESAAIAREAGVRVYTDYVEKLKLPGESYRAVTMWQVIEHLPDPQIVLEECHRLLEAGGILAVSTPNIKSIGWRLLRENWSPVEPTVHPHLFSAGTLQKLLEQAGFSTAKINCVDLQPSTVQMVRQQLFGKSLKKPRNAAASLAATIDTRRLTALFAALRAINLPLAVCGMGEDIYGFFVKTDRAQSAPQHSSSR